MVGWTHFPSATDLSGSSIFPTDGDGNAYESYFWSSTERDGDEVYLFGAHQKYIDAQAFISYQRKSTMSTVRCVEDDPVDP